ncbi:MAG: hypothetical protein JWQ29_1298 [Phenylobacterium sp.]|nr:hypothetical protein [Phenylobacterium sp.]
MALSALAAGLLGPGPANGQQTGTRLPPATPANSIGDDGALLETAFDTALRMTVPVYVEGKGPFPFVIDTGANRSVVSEEVARFCGLPDAGVAPVHGIIGSQPAHLADVRRMRVGQVVSTGLRLPVLPQSRLGGAGILGVDFLRGRRVTLGFRDQTFEIEPSRSGPQIGRDGGSRIGDPSRPVTVPARFRSGQLIILDAEAVERPVIAFLDSGSQVTVANRALRDLVFAARPDLLPRVIHSQLLSATGQRASAEFAPLPRLRLGGQLLDTPLVAFSDLHIFDLWDLQAQPAILIGVDILRRFDRVACDFGRKQITFWPRRGPAARLQAP